MTIPAPLEMTWLIDSLLSPVNAASPERAIVDAVQFADHGRSQQAVVVNGEKILGDEKEMFAGGHPLPPIEAGKIDGPRKCSQRAVAAQVEIDVEVAERELPQRTINRLAITASG